MPKTDPKVNAKLTTHCKKRLRSLEKALRNPELKRKRFDMGTWFRGRKIDTKLSHCGTKACAAGLASALPSWRRDGYILRSSGPFQTIEPYYNDNSGYDALAEYLEIDVDESRYLFSPLSYNVMMGPKTVANRINKFIEVRS